MALAVTDRPRASLFSVSPLLAHAVKLVAARLARMAALLLALSFALFGVLSALPGDPVDLLVTSNPDVRAEDVARLKKLRGLDKPWPVRWARWLIGHDEALAPPVPPAPDPVVVEMPVEGPAEVQVQGRTLRFDAAGVHVVPSIVRDEHGLEAIVLTEVLVAPTLSPVPTPMERGRTLDDAERQLAGSTEHSIGVGRASEADLMAAARALGPARPPGIALEGPRAFTARDDGEAIVDAGALCRSCSSDVRFEVDDGPGDFDASGRWRHRFAGAGQTAVVFRAVAPDGGSAQGAFVVEHGLVEDPARFHRGALFVLVGDTEALGYSSTYRRPVWELLFGAPPASSPTEGRGLSERVALTIQRFGRVQNTVVLMAPAFLLSLLIAIPLGVVAASRRGALVDRLILGASTVGLSIPSFWLGIMAIVVFAAKLHVLPAGGIQTPGLPPDLVDVLADRARHAILPVTVLALAYSASWIRYIRSGVIDVLPQDFVRTARAKGAPPRVVLHRHALRNALLPLVTVIALAAPHLFAGALLTEIVFAWPGVGRLQYEAILNNDSYVAIVVFLVSAALVLVASLAADLLYLVVDPRLRRRGIRNGVQG